MSNKNKETAKTDVHPTYYKACKVSEDTNVDGVFPPLFKKLVKAFAGMLGMSENGIALPFTSLTSFFLVKAVINIVRQRTSQPLNVWSIIVAPPGRKNLLCTKYLWRMLSNLFKMMHATVITRNVVFLTSCVAMERVRL